MMLKVGNDYLDFNGTVELEQKTKLFENLDSSDGDVSFQFDVDETHKNFRLLGYPVPDSSSKSVYQRIDCDLQDDSGVSLRTGFLRIERRIKRDKIALSFFSGNSNWFGLISGNLQDMNMSQYDIDQTEASIVSSWSNTEGITFPLVDNGGLLTRSFAQVKVEDLVGGFYVKTVFKKIFQDSYIKLRGELFDEPLYNKLITIKNSKSQSEIDQRTIYVQKTITQTINDASEHVIEWDNDSTYPYFNNGSFNLATESYLADVGEIVNVEFSIQAITYGIVSPTRIFLRVNGIDVDLIFFAPLNAGDNSFIGSFKYRLQTNDVVTLAILAPFTTDLVSGTLKITPTFVYKTFGNSALPNWTKQDYVSSIFQVFNVITSFDPKTKTLTCNLFDKLKEKEPIDISRYVTVEETDYVSFISSFGKKSTFSYNEVDFDEIKDYNIANFFKYGQGFIPVNNDFLSEEESVIGSKFSNPLSYINGVFDMSMERLNLIEYDEGESIDNTSVSNPFTNARFNIPEDIFLVGDLVRLSDFTNPVYNGDWVVSGLGSGYVEFLGIAYDTDATGTLTKLDYTYNNSDDVFLLVNIPIYPTSKFTGNPFIFLEANSQAAWAVAYFSLLNTNRQINIDYKQSLSFGEIQDPLFYQRTILETYWSLVSRVLNDPVKPICTAVMPTNIYRSIDFLRPLMIRTLETVNLYYVNRMGGYQSSYDPFDIDLIKLG